MSEKTSVNDHDWFLHLIFRYSLLQNKYVLYLALQWRRGILKLYYLLWVSTSLRVAVIRKSGNSHAGEERGILVTVCDCESVVVMQINL